MSDFDLWPGQGCACGNDPACESCGCGAAYQEQDELECQKWNEEQHAEN